MKIDLTEINGICIAEVISEEMEIKNAQDALDIMMNCIYQGASNLIIYQKNFLPAFFDLKTGMAGEILQKFSNYRAKLAIVGDFENLPSKSLRDFIFESNKHGNINFVSSVNQAKAILSKG